MTQKKHFFVVFFCYHTPAAVKLVYGSVYCSKCDDYVYDVDIN